jgi:hypothetical protein
MIRFLPSIYTLFLLSIFTNFGAIQLSEGRPYTLSILPLRKTSSQLKIYFIEISGSSVVIVFSFLTNSLNIDFSKFS